MYFTSKQLVDFFTTSGVNNGIKQSYHIALPWDAAGVDGGIERGTWGQRYADTASFDYSAVNMDKVLEVMHESIADGLFLDWKALRPWVVCDVTAELDPEQPWIGWEIETGWNTHAGRYEVTTLFNQRYRYSCTDNEGYGSYPVELTFSPQTPGYYTSRGTPVHPLLFVAGQADKANVHRPSSSVGTHINFSTPSFRSSNYQTKQRVEGALNNSICTLSYEQRGELFGRKNLYAGCFLRGDNNSESGNGVMWIEGKLFNSTYDAAVAKGYIEVGNRLCLVMEQLAALGDELRIKVVTNFYDMLSGKDTAIITESAMYLRDGDEIDGNYDDDDDDDANPPPDGEWENEDGETWCSECNEYH